MESAILEIVTLYLKKVETLNDLEREEIMKFLRHLRTPIVTNNHT